MASLPVNLSTKDKDAILSDLAKLGREERVFREVVEKFWILHIENFEEHDSKGDIDCLP